ncbi:MULTISPECIES: type I secretion system permease/ATPase [unclassified Bosea (in: a-proteobacteria)]|uniref:type I secretion system permease/ATPase n=1 Tax=unclassified Bosea (in: a-proteobacteria) TaxID=2653178 RepID=UPI0025C12CC7|nr:MULTISPECIES: type I secretion system permease/ATPase [unclassified Bosea (in: a-proteobacteria)]
MSDAPASRTTSGFRTRVNADTAVLRSSRLLMAVPGWRALLWVVVFSLAINLLLLILPFYSIQVFDRVLTSGSIETLIGLTSLAVMALGFSACFDILRSRLLGRFAVSFERLLAPLVLKASIAEAAKRNEAGTHDMVRVRELRNILSSGTATTLIDAPFLPVFVVVLYLIHPWYGTVALIGSLLLLFLGFVSGRVARAELAEAMGTASRAQRALDGIVGHANLVRAMGWTHGAIREFLRLNDAALVPVVKANERVALIASIARAIRIVLQVAAIGIGAWLVLQNEVLSGSMMASSILISRTLAPMEQLVGGLRTLTSARDAWLHVRAAAACALIRQSRTLLPPPLGALDISAVAFRSPNARRPVLAGISFRCPPASVIVVIGPTGAGKSTLLRMIAALEKPTTGTIRLDGASLEHWDPDQLGHYVGYLPQDVELLGGTVAEAIAGFDETATDADVIGAAKQANAHQMILALPNGYETEIGRDGNKLSGGQRQRIGLARALFGTRKLILLDEPNSNLDPDGEEALCAAIREAKAQGATLVIVTHRPRLFTVADMILFLRDGVQVAFGPPGEVLPQTMAGVTPMRPSRPAPGGKVRSDILDGRR